MSRNFENGIKQYQSKNEIYRVRCVGCSYPPE